MYLSIPLFVVLLVASQFLPGNALSSPPNSVKKTSTHTQLFASQGNTEDTDDSTSTTSIDCAIIGGGPASFVTAIAISKASPSSSIAIFEKDAFQPKGASIQISNSGWKSIKELDESLVQKLEDTGVPVTGVGMKSWKYDSNDDNGAEGNGENAIKIFLKKNLSKVKSKATQILFSRAIRKTHLWHDVRVALRDHAIKTYDVTEADESSGDRSLLNLNCALEEIHPLHNDDKDGEGDNDRFELTLINTQNGEEKKVRAKYLFACDGTKSKVRSVLPNEPDILLAENKSVWRGMAPNVSTSGKATFFIGKSDSDTAGRSALIFPGGKDAGSSWTVISDIENGKSTSTEEARKRVLKVIDTMGMSGTEASTTESGNNNEYAQLKQAIDDSSIIIENKLHVRDFDQPWESAYDGLIYIGDSAHPVRPTGEGTALAFEDANVLGQVISKYGLGVRSLREYENERYDVVKKISEKVRASSEALYKPNDQAP